MDEILASIRRIIADDQDPVKGTDGPEDGVAEPGIDSASENEPPPRVVLSAEPPDWNEEVSIGPMAEPEIDIVRDEPSPVLRLAEVMSASSPRAADPPLPPDPPRPAESSRLISNETTASVNHAFNMLSHTVLSQNARTLEDLVKDMLRPMLKTWLDDNLPPLVEGLVRAEIERVSRGHR